MKLSPHQIKALADAAHPEGLVRRRDGWAREHFTFEKHGFQTVNSLLSRELLEHVTSRMVRITPRGRELLA